MALLHLVRWPSKIVAMRTQFAFGKTGLTLDLPDGFEYKVLEARSASPLPDQLGAMESAMDAPIAGPSIKELASGKKTAAISVCDITRPAPNKLVLPPLLKRLHAAGIARENVTILIATGLHRLATPPSWTRSCRPRLRLNLPHRQSQRARDCPSTGSWATRSRHAGVCRRGFRRRRSAHHARDSSSRI